MSRRLWIATGVAALVAAAGGGATAVVTRSGTSGAAPAQHTSDVAVTHSAAAPAAPLRVVAIGHAPTDAVPASQSAVTVVFSAPVPDDVLPTLSPAVAGRWTRPTPTTASFVPTAAPLPGTTLTVTVPAGTVDTAGGVLAAAASTSWTTRAADPARVQQLLAEAGYLPLSFTPATAEPAGTDALTASAYEPVTGSYAWRFAAPAGLAHLYTGATSTLLTRGAVLAFEADHHLTTDGAAGPAVLAALVSDLAAGTTNHDPYTYVSVTKSRPETLTLYQDGEAVLSTPANTGVAGAPTPDGSWAVFYRTPSQTMTGTNPDGTKYSDPGVPWISYFNGGDAVHGFPRSSYGSPQSVGCVELPIATAKTVYGLMGYGDIVTISG